jgi:multicomponent Na+:H+ antiporter subunit D
VVGALAAVVLGAGVGFELVSRFVEAAVAAALDTGAYVDAVGVTGGDPA